jgi:predicted patatin/cPLA2 family phospholipase
MNKMLQYSEPDEYDNVKVVRVHPADAIKKMKHHAYQHDFAYIDDYEALEEFIILHWAEWVEVEKE